MRRGLAAYWTNKIWTNTIWFKSLFGDLNELLNLLIGEQTSLVLADDHDFDVLVA